MTEGGTSKKLTVAGIGIAALLAVTKAEQSYLSYFAEAGITAITLAAIAVQAWLDMKNGGQ